MEKTTDYTKTFLLPPSLEDWIPEEHPARFIREFVDSINLEEYGFREASVKEGRPPYSNNLMLKIWLYSYYEKIYSCRSIERACRNQMPLLWLTSMHYPDHNTVWRFFKKNRSKIKEIFKHTVKIALKNEMIGFVVQAVDGTKINADVSKNKELYQPDLEKLLSIVDNSIEEASQKIEKTQEEEKEIPDDKLPPKLYGKKKLQKLIKEGVESLRKDEKAKLKEKLEEDLCLLEEKDRVKLNSTDKDARLMKTKGRKDFCYNAQGIVDSKKQIIVGAKVTNAETDNHLLTDMIQEVKNNSGKVSDETLGDCGYFSGEELYKAEESEFSVLVSIPKERSKKEKGFRKEDFTYNPHKDSYLCKAKSELKFSCEYFNKNRNKNVRVYKCKDYKSCCFRENCCGKKSARRIERYDYDEAVIRHKERQKEEKNMELLKKRPQIVEPVFAWIKHNNNFKRWLYRGLKSVNAQWLLLSSATNLRKLYQVWREGELNIC